MISDTAPLKLVAPECAPHLKTEGCDQGYCYTPETRCPIYSQAHAKRQEEEQQTITALLKG